MTAWGMVAWIVFVAILLAIPISRAVDRWIWGQPKIEEETDER